MRILLVEDDLKIAAFVQKGLQAGADDYLTKPFAFSENSGKIEHIF